MVSISDNVLIGYLVVEKGNITLIPLGIPIPPDAIPLTYGMACQVNDLRKTVERKGMDTYWGGDNN